MVNLDCSSSVDTGNSDACLTPHSFLYFPETRQDDSLQ